MNRIEETKDAEYPFKILWGNGTSWSLCKSRQEAEDRITNAILKDHTWLTTPHYNRY